MSAPSGIYTTPQEIIFWRDYNLIKNETALVCEAGRQHLFLRKKDPRQYIAKK
jgi:hypothetical protein